MGFWHTGYAEFHEPTGLGEYVYTPPPPVRYSCEHCTQSFANLEALRKHRFEQHPVRQPTLLLRGKPVGALTQVLMTPLGPADVLVEDATVCLLNGQPLPPARGPAACGHAAGVRRSGVEQPGGYGALSAGLPGCG